MKKVRVSCCAMLLVFAVLGMTGCVNQDKGSGNETGTSTGSPSSYEETSFEAGSSGAERETGGAGMSEGNGGTSMVGGKDGSNADGSRMEETTGGGVIDGLIHDVEKGVDEITGETSMSETGTAQ